MSSFTLTAPAVLTARPMARPTARVESATTPVRLTRRGRLVVFGLLTLLIVGLSIALGPSTVATAERGAPVPVQVVIVDDGDTLWDIASRVAAPGETAEMVHKIQELNALPTASLRAGQELAVPRD